MTESNLKKYSSNIIKVELWFLLLLASVLQLVWGLTPIASKFVIEDIPVELYITIRWTLSGFIFAGILLFQKKWVKICKVDFLQLTGLGIVGFCVASFGTLYGLSIGGITNFALMGALGPVITSLVSIWILREKPNKYFYISLPFCIAGLFALVFGKYQISTFNIAVGSVLCVMIGYFLDALVFVFSKKFKNQMSSIQYLAQAQLSAAFIMWILQLCVFRQFSAISHLSMRGLLGLVFVVMVSCTLCYAVLYWLLQYLEGHKLALFDGLHALSATLFGHLIFQESAGFMMYLGGTFIFVGLIIAHIPLKATIK